MACFHIETCMDCGNETCPDCLTQCEDIGCSATLCRDCVDDHKATHEDEAREDQESGGDAEG